VTDHFYELGMDEELERMHAVIEHINQRSHIEISMTDQDALNLANFARVYYQVSPEMAAAVAQSRISWDNPALQDIVLRDVEEQENRMWTLIQAPAKAAMMGIGLAGFTLWEEGIMRPARTITRMAQGEDFGEAYRRAGPSDVVAAIGEVSQGRRANLGSLNPFKSETGYFPNSRLAQNDPEFRDNFTAAFKERSDQADAEGRVLDMHQTQSEIYEELSDEFYTQNGRPITYEQQAFREMTMVNKTIGGRTYSTPFSFGRAFAIQVSRPDTAMFKTISGGLDLGSQIVLDPLNMPFDEIQKAYKARNLIVPAYHNKAVNNTLRQVYERKLGEVHIETVDALDPRLADPLGITAGATELRPSPRVSGGDFHEIYLNRSFDTPIDDAAWSRWAENRAGTDPYANPNAIDPYATAYDEMGVTNDEFREVLEQYGEYGVHDLTLEHELIHAEMQGRKLDEIVDVGDEIDNLQKRIDDFERQLDPSAEPPDELLAMYEDVDVLKQERLNELFQLEVDATKQAWQRLKTGVSEGKRLRIEAAKEVGTHLSWRPWIKVRTAEDFYRDTARGRRTLEYLANETEFPAINELLGELPVQTQLRVLDAKTADQVLDALKGPLGLTPARAPVIAKTGKMLGVRHSAQGVLGHFRQESTLSIWGRRWLAESSDMKLDPFNIEHSLTNLRNYLHTVAAESSDVHRLMVKMALAEGNPYLFRQVYHEALDVTEKTLIRHGYDDVDIRRIMEEYREAVELNTQYLQDLAGNPIYEEGSRTMIMRDSKGNKTEAFIGDSHHDAQFAEHLTVLPNLRDIRRITGTTRAFTDKVRLFMGADIKIGQSLAGVVLDAVLSTWRNAVLLRPAWVIRVISEELLRMPASGYSQIFRHPDDFFMLVLHDSFAGKGVTTDLFGDDLGAALRAKGLGAGGWAVDTANEPLRGTRFDAARVNWTMVPVYKEVNGVMQITEGGRIGLGREYIQMHNSILISRVARDGVDAAFDYFTKDPDGVAALQRIVRDATADSPNKKLLNETFLRNKLESAHFRIAMYSGGDVIYRQASSSQWLDSMGRPIDDPKAWDAIKQKEALQRHKYDGRSKLTTAEQRTRVLRDLEGLPDLDALGNRQFVVLKEGKDDLRQLIAEGVDTDGVTRIKKAADETTENMTRREIMELEDWLPSQFDGDYQGPAMISAPNERQAARLAANKGKVVRIIFNSLMSRRTDEIVRSPFARIIYTEEAARYYVYASDAGRAQFDAWLKLNPELQAMFNEFLAENLKIRKLKKLPVVGEQGFTFEELDRVAKATAVNKTREKFYELGRRRNFVDAGRLIAPFADAWFEVLSRWAKMLDPTGLVGDQPGLAARNLRRIGQFEHSGFFSEDEHGNEVFNWPGFGLLSGGVKDAFGTRANLGQLMFVDPNPRSIMLPGTSAVFQIPASLVQPILPEGKMKELFNWAVFGEYRPVATSSLGNIVKAVAPTWMKRVIESGLTDENLQAYADDILQLYSGLLIEQGRPATREEAIKLIDQAQRIATPMTFARIADSFILPAGTQYVPRFFSDVGKTSDPGFWLDVAFLGRELREATELFDGDKIAAQRYILDRYGADPLNVVGKTSRIVDRPDSREGYLKLEEYPELRKFLPTSLMALIPEPPDAFYEPAWEAMLQEGTVEYLTPEEGAQIISRNGGSRAFDALQERYKIALNYAKEVLREGTPTYREWVDKELDKWFRIEKANIATEYFAWGEDKTVWGNTSRPTYGVIFDELNDVTVLGSESRRVASEVNPEMVDFLDFTFELWDYLDEYSLSLGHEEKWWRTATPSLGGSVREQYELREWFANGVKLKMQDLSEDNLISASWVIQSVLTPLMNGWEFDDKAYFMPEDPPPLPRVSVGDVVYEWDDPKNIVDYEAIILQEEAEAVNAR
jgi:hypothetical protein